MICKEIKNFSSPIVPRGCYTICCEFIVFWPVAEQGFFRWRLQPRWGRLSINSPKFFRKLHKNEIVPREAPLAPPPPTTQVGFNLKFWLVAWQWSHDYWYDLLNLVEQVQFLNKVKNSFVERFNTCVVRYKIEFATDLSIFYYQNLCHLWIWKNLNVVTGNVILTNMTFDTITNVVSLTMFT